MLNRHRHTRRLMNQMNVVPYIDVMLVLLVIFMVTTPMFTPSAINVPRVSDAQPIPSTKKPIEVVITENGYVKISTDNEQSTLPINSNQTLDTIKSWASKLADKEQPIAISADKNQTYNNVLQVVAALHAGGAKKVALTVEKKTARP